MYSEDFVEFIKLCLEINESNRLDAHELFDLIKKINADGV